MGSRFHKKICGAIIFILLSAVIMGNSVISNQLNEIYNGNYKTVVDFKSIDEKTNFSVVLNIGDKNNLENSIKIVDISISNEESDSLFEELNMINDKMLASNDLDESAVLMEQALNLLYDYDMIPSALTMDNMSKLILEIGNSISNNRYNDVLINDDYETPGRVQGKPFVGIGPGVFSYVSLLGTVTPYGLWNLTTFRAVGNLSTIDIKMNKTGIYLYTDGPLLKPIFDAYLDDGTLLTIHGPIWQSLWNFIGENQHRNYTEMHGIGVYMVHAIIGHSISYAIAASLYNLMDSTLIRPIIGSFYFFGAPTIPISITLYKTHPIPWTTVVDIGIVFSMLGQVIIPFWYPDSPIN